MTYCTRHLRLLYPTGWVQRSLLYGDVSAIRHTKIRARPCKSSDVISLKYTDIRGVF